MKAARPVMHAVRLVLLHMKRCRACGRQGAACDRGRACETAPYEAVLGRLEQHVAAMERACETAPYEALPGHVAACGRGHSI